MIVVSPSGAQPSSARKFISAGATYPSSRSSSTPCAPWRLESFLPSVPSTFGTCAYTGRSPPAARMMLICFGVLEMWSSPRITCVIPSHTSSIGEAKL